MSKKIFKENNHKWVVEIHLQSCLAQTGFLEINSVHRREATSFLCVPGSHSMMGQKEAKQCGQRSLIWRDAG